MKNAPIFKQVMMLALTLLTLSLPAWAQAKKQGVVAPGILRIHEVSKRDVADAPAGQLKQVPVLVKAAIEDGELQEMKVEQIIAELVTLNTDGKQTRITEKYEQLKGLVTMKLPMANGVFAKSFTLNMTATVLVRGKREILRASKSGSF